ncbi:MAG: antitoxin [Actinomycetota bacterium]|nr:antitoxin [Actinomycetota bacterium]MDQ3354472.1 antitoxin [Actinomycetota bacterium]
MAETATIRVTRVTRDQLAEEARRRGVSLAMLLAGIAQQRETAAMVRSESEAALLDSENPDVEEEDRDWEATLEDGIE